MLVSKLFIASSPSTRFERPVDDTGPFLGLASRIALPACYESVSLECGENRTLVDGDGAVKGDRGIGKLSRP